MKVLELFAGERSIGKAFEAKGHEVFSIEWDKSFKNIDLYADIGKITANEIVQKFGLPDVIWASPDCTTFSIAAIVCNCLENFGFVLLAFAGVYPMKELLMIAISTSIIEAAIAVCDTPFLYIAKRIRNAD